MGASASTSQKNKSVHFPSQKNKSVNFPSQKERIVTKLGSVITNVISFGVVGFDQGGINISTPIDRIMHIPQVINSLTKDYQTGVWQGKQSLDALTLSRNNILRIGIYSDLYLLNKLNYSICHEAVLINSRIYSFEGESKAKAKIIETNDSNYTWKYKGNCQKSEYEIKKWIDSFNKNESYNLLSNNCQMAADQLICFAISMFMT